MRAALIWAAVAAGVLVPLVVATQSPLLAWRQPVYIAAGFAGIIGLALLLVQPLLALGWLPGLRGPRGRRVHRWGGAALLAAILLHVAGLWVTSPPDMVDALLLRSPTPFSVWGVLAMWAVCATAVLALWRRRLGPKRWRAVHLGLATLILGGSVLHAVLIEGAMGTASKLALCALALAATCAVLSRALKR